MTLLRFLPAFCCSTSKFANCAWPPTQPYSHAYTHTCTHANTCAHTLLSTMANEAEVGNGFIAAVGDKIEIKRHDAKESEINEAANRQAERKEQGYKKAEGCTGARTCRATRPAADPAYPLPQNALPLLIRARKTGHTLLVNFSYCGGFPQFPFPAPRGPLQASAWPPCDAAAAAVPLCSWLREGAHSKFLLAKHTRALNGNKTHIRFEKHVQILALATRGCAHLPHESPST